MKKILILIVIGTFASFLSAFADDLNFTALVSPIPEPKNHVLLPTPEPSLSELFPGAFIKSAQRENGSSDGIVGRSFDNDARLMRDYQQQWEVYRRSSPREMPVPVYNPSKIQRELK